MSRNPKERINEEIDEIEQEMETLAKNMKAIDVQLGQMAKSVDEKGLDEYEHLFAMIESDSIDEFVRESREEGYKPRQVAILYMRSRVFAEVKDLGQSLEGLSDKVFPKVEEAAEELGKGNLERAEKLIERAMSRMGSVEGRYERVEERLAYIKTLSSRFSLENWEENIDKVGNQLETLERLANDVDSKLVELYQEMDSARK